MIHLDTSFVVDLLRERRRSELGPATRLAGALRDEEVALSVFVRCELLLGAERSERPEQELPKVEAFCRSVRGVEFTEGLASHYARLAAHLMGRGESLATMDLLIAATALGHEAPLVTRNRRHFERVPGLLVLSY